MTIEEQLIGLLKEHGLSSLALTAYAGGADGPWFSGTAQAHGECAFDDRANKQSAASVIASSIGRLNAKLRPPEVEVPALAPMETAA